jgi:NADPH:quinone reductase-like Zn-dependent oxidoreductase
VDTMMALRAHVRGGPEQLLYEQAPKPDLAPGEVLVRVRAAGITFAELGWDSTWTSAEGSDRTPVIPGHEVSGTVELTTIGSPFEVGDEVYGLIKLDRDGAAAQYVSVPEQALALKPRTVTHQQAAAMPMSGLTAWQAMIDRAELRPEDRVLIIGASGGVGMYAVQLAKSRGAEVVAFGNEAGRGLVTRLGADRYLNYRSESVASIPSGFDVVLDAAGVGDDEGLYNALRPGGRMILLNGAPHRERARERGVRAGFFIVSATPEELIRLAEFVDRGTLQPIVSQTFPLAEGRAAYESGRMPHPPGKTVLVVS